MSPDRRSLPFVNGDSYGIPVPSCQINLHACIEKPMFHVPSVNPSGNGVTNEYFNRMIDVQSGQYTRPRANGPDGDISVVATLDPCR